MSRAGPQSEAGPSRAARRFAAIVGVGEVATGLVLLGAPGVATRLLGVAPPPDATIFLRWIGAFVLATGLAYLLPWLRPEGAARDARLLAGVEWSSAARLVVATFVAVADLAGELSPGWCAVGIYDGTVAVVQLAWLGRGGFGR